MPSLGMITLSAFACADNILIPVQVAYLPVKGLEQLIKAIGNVKRQLNPKLEIEGILLKMVDTDKYYRVIESGNWLILPYEKNGLRQVANICYKL